MMFNAEEAKKRRDPDKVRLGGMVRRVRFSGAIAGKWTLRGVKGAYNEEEAFERVEAFQGIGFTSVPRAAGRPEAIVVQVGGAPGNSVAIAARDKGTPCPVAVGPDETAMFNSIRAVKVADDGVIELGVSPTQALVRGTAYRAAEDTMLTAVQLALTALAGHAALSAITTALTTAATAITNFQAGAATYLTTAARTE